MKNSMKKTIFLLASLLLSHPIFAKTMYITDSFEVPLRTGQTSAYRILAYPKSGSALEVLEVGDKTGYSKVKTQRGTEGWVLTRFLISKPIAKYRLLQVEKQLASLKKKNKVLSSSQSAASKITADIENQNKLLQATNITLEKELNYVKKISGNTININQRNKKLIEENQQLKNEFDLLNSDNERLKDNANSQYFMLGIGAILLGIILGLVLPSLKPKRKDSGWI